ncbi:MAG: ABC transporter permease [Gammaproteobacteria bacterium]|nr:ABC transporter permease [Gammaproteobacteria bacterium]
MISFKRFLAILKARNLEFFRDKASLSWSIIFPVLLLVGFAFVFSDDDKSIYKVGVLNNTEQGSDFKQLKYLEFIDYQQQEQALNKLRQHKIDLLFDAKDVTYWINDTSPNGYIVEQLLLGHDQVGWQKETVTGRQIRYLDWVVPGILGMNMMFSCLFGVGYVIVRYRKSMVLKRLNATPVTALEFLLAQITSRLFIVMFISSFIFVGCNFLFDFYMLGSYLDLFIIAVLGAFALISLGLFIASRSQSEELTGGLLNLATWPMMVFSGVWFSLEGSPEIIQQIAWLFPLTHLVEGARSVMTEGATLIDIGDHIALLSVMIVIFLSIGTWSFKWNGDGR